MKNDSNEEAVISGKLTHSKNIEYRLLFIEKLNALLKKNNLNIDHLKRL